MILQKTMSGSFLPTSIIVFIVGIHKIRHRDNNNDNNNNNNSNNNILSKVAIAIIVITVIILLCYNINNINH